LPEFFQFQSVFVEFIGYLFQKETGALIMKID